MILLMMIIAAVALRFILPKFKGKKSYYLLCYLGATAPLILLIIEVIPQGAMSVIVAGFCLFYFAILSGRGSKGDKHL